MRNVMGLLLVGCCVLGAPGRSSAETVVVGTIFPVHKEIGLQGIEFSFLPMADFEGCQIWVEFYTADFVDGQPSPWEKHFAGLVTLDGSDMPLPGVPLIRKTLTLSPAVVPELPYGVFVYYLDVTEFQLIPNFQVVDHPIESSVFSDDDGASYEFLTLERLIGLTTGVDGDGGGTNIMVHARPSQPTP